MFATIPPPPNRLLVFARLPEHGRVKTRLARDLGDDRALAVYEAMLRDLFANIGAPGDALEIEVVWAPTETANGAALKRAFDDYPLAMQSGDTLGDRLCMAFSERFFFHRTQKVVAIGVDEPALTRAPRAGRPPRPRAATPPPASWSRATGSSAPPPTAATTSSAAAPRRSTARSSAASSGEAAASSRRRSRRSTHGRRRWRCCRCAATSI